jgi:RNA polymerase sigma factor for flagellar operon FliA
MNYLPLARFAVERLNVPANGSLGREDLLSHALLGLIDAVDNFDPGRDVRFESYASRRVRGAVLDALRKMDWMPRRLRRSQRQLRQAYAKLEGQFGRAATDAEVCAELEWTQDDLDQVLQGSALSATVSLDDMLCGSDGSDSSMRVHRLEDTSCPNPFTEATLRERRESLTRAIGELAERDQLVLQLYYHEEMTLREIAEILEITESRVCQIHSRAILRLQNKLRVYIDDSLEPATTQTRQPAGRGHRAA